MEIVDYLLAKKKAGGGGSAPTIEQLSVTENGTYSEQGIAYSPVVVNVPAPENSYQLTDIPTGTVSTIEDGTDLPMSSLKVGIEPVQEGSGDPSPDNIRPISGWTAANVSVSPTTSAEDGTTYNIQFRDGDNPLTVYGGTLDVTSGELTVTDAYIASYNGETLPSTWISDRDVYAEGTTPTTGAEVVYKLANSVTYHLTPTQVRTLVGNNNIWADTGDIIEGKYYRSPF